MSEKNYYEILELEREATPDQLKASFRHLAKLYHPDANRDNPNAATIFKRINEAYDVLSDPAKRAEYDKTLYTSLLRAPNTSLDGTGIYLDDYDKFPEKCKLDEGGGDITVEIPVMPTELVTGAVKDIRFERKEVCDACAGSGAKQTTKCTTCSGTGEITFYIDTEKGIDSFDRRCKMCFGTGLQVTKECPKCQGAGMIKTIKALRVPVPKGARNGLVMVKKGDGHRSRMGHSVGSLKLVVKLMKLNIKKK